MPIIEKEEGLKINDFGFHLEKLEDKQICFQERRKELIKIRKESNKIVNKKETTQSCLWKC